jgi:hypothetical protein
MIYAEVVGEEAGVDKEVLDLPSAKARARASILVRDALEVVVDDGGPELLVVRRDGDGDVAREEMDARTAAIRACISVGCRGYNRERLSVSYDNSCSRASSAASSGMRRN